MIANYLKVAIRNLMRNKTFSAINILGLAIGMGLLHAHSPVRSG